MNPSQIQVNFNNIDGQNQRGFLIDQNHGMDDANFARNDIGSRNVQNQTNKTVNVNQLRNGVVNFL